MLQRAAGHAYSWWWASHIRTKQSKWLEQNLQDMEEKVNHTLKIIDEDGDSFAKRAEMYYKKRPELINFVEESYRAYRALAERYDHISRELQNANRTIATVFPEQVQFAMDDEDEENFPEGEKSTPSQNQDEPPKGLPPAIPKPIIPKIAKIPTKDFKASPMFISKKGPLKRPTSSAKTTMSSGLSKTEASEEINKLQKEILVLQTEKEFVKSSYESGFAKYWEIENQITEMQGKVSSLQDEFGIGMVIEDYEAQILMAATALKSCQQTLVQLQEKQQQSAEEARIECQRIKEVHEKLETLKDEFLEKQTDWQELAEEHESVSTGLDQLVDGMEQERIDLEMLREKIKGTFEVNSSKSLNVTEMAEKIDELVDKVITLETAVSSQNALVKKLRSETDELQAHIRSLEEEKGTPIEGSNNMSNKLRELEEELNRVKSLNQSIEDKNHNLQTHFNDASCNLGHLSEKLQSMKPDEEVKSMDLFTEVIALPDAKPEKEFEEHEYMLLAPGTGSEILKDVKPEAEETKDEVKDLSNSVKAEEEENFVQSNLSNNLHVLSEEIQVPKQQQKDKKQELSQTVDSDLDIETELDQPNWRQMFLNGLENREKFLLDEYTSILRNFKEVKKKLIEVEKKNRDSLFESAMQIRELKNANALKDEEIQSLHKKLSSPQPNSGVNLDTSSTEYKSIIRGGSSRFFTISSLNSEQQPVSNLVFEQNVEPTEKLEELTAKRRVGSPTKVEENAIKVIPVDEPSAVSSIEEKLRTDIDDLLEENLEFWLRFSTSFHQIQKFQTSIQDLQGELSKLKKNKQEGSTKHHQSLKSDARPIYKHLREIQTELILWLEHNSELKDELQSRFSSLCSIQEEISRVSNAGSKEEETELSNYQAAKFQGEVLNMKQENNKVADELKAGLNRVESLQVEVERTMSKLDEEFKISESKSHHLHMKSSLSRSRIPLRSFLFGVRLKKKRLSLFPCTSPALQKQYSDLTAAIPPP